jgi:hypothetical protein
MRAPLIHAALALLLLACDRPAVDSGPDDSEPATQDSDLPDDSDTPAHGWEGEHSLAQADLRLYAAEPQQHSGRVLGVGDLDGDGDDELVVTTVRDDEYQGGAWVIADPPEEAGTLPQHGQRLEGSVDTLGAGRSVGLGDTDGDGRAELLLGAPYPGCESVFLLWGPFDQQRNVAEAAVRLQGQERDYSGHGSDLADLNGDGLADVIVGAYGADLGGEDSGAVMVVHAPLQPGTHSLALTADAVLVGASPGDAMGRKVKGGGDVDGDGLADLLVASSWADRDGTDRGVVHLALAPFGGATDLADAQAALVGERPGDQAGMDVTLADVDGDGRADPVVGAQGSPAELYGAVYVLTELPAGETDLGDAAIVIRGERAGWALGWGVAAAPLEPGARAALLLGALGAGEAEEAPGAAYLFQDLEPGAWTTADADARLMGEAHGSYAGLGVALGDLDGDGLGDLLVGAPLEPSGGEAGGAAYGLLSGLPGLPR